MPACAASATAAFDRSAEAAAWRSISVNRGAERAGRGGHHPDVPGRIARGLGHAGRAPGGFARGGGELGRGRLHLGRRRRDHADDLAHRPVEAPHQVVHRAGPALALGLAGRLGGAQALGLGEAVTEQPDRAGHGADLVAPLRRRHVGVEMALGEGLHGAVEGGERPADMPGQRPGDGERRQRGEAEHPEQVRAARCRAATRSAMSSATSIVPIAWPA